MDNNLKNTGLAGLCHRVKIFRDYMIYLLHFSDAGSERSGKFPKLTKRDTVVEELLVPCPNCSILTFRDGQNGRDHLFKFLSEVDRIFIGLCWVTHGNQWTWRRSLLF